MKDPYVYKGSDVLINKLNIKDKEKLDEFENRMSKLAILRMFKEEIVVKSLKDIFRIHKLMFGNVYEWAGSSRTINIYKQEPILNGLSVEYSDYKTINKTLSKIDKKYFEQDLKLLIKEDFIHIFIRMITEIWKVHPFREGNTRTISMFAFLLLKQTGYKYNALIVEKNSKFFRNALVMASLGPYAEMNYLSAIITDVLDNEIVVQNKKYQKINNYNVDDYEYEYHKIKV